MIAALAFRSDLQNERDPGARSLKLSLSAGPLGSMFGHSLAMALRSPLPNQRQSVYGWEHYTDKQSDLGKGLHESQCQQTALSRPERSARP